jgi:hypothetical protein
VLTGGASDERDRGQSDSAVETRLHIRAPLAVEEESPRLRHARGRSSQPEVSLPRPPRCIRTIRTAPAACPVGPPSRSESRRPFERAGNGSPPPATAGRQGNGSPPPATAGRQGNGSPPPATAGRQWLVRTLRGSGTGTRCHGVRVEVANPVSDGTRARASGGAFVRPSGGTAPMPPHDWAHAEVNPGRAPRGAPARRRRGTLRRRQSR